MQRPDRRCSADPLRAQPEVEPNDSFEQAQPVSTRAPVELRIAERSDHDFFSFRLTDAANLRLKLSADRRRKPIFDCAQRWWADQGTRSRRSGRT